MIIFGIKNVNSYIAGTSAIVSITLYLLRFLAAQLSPLASVFGPFSDEQIPLGPVARINGVEYA